MRFLYIAGIAITAGVLTSGCASSAGGSGADVVDSVESPQPVTQSATPTEAPPGTRDNPLPIGTTIQLPEWQVQVASVNLDGTQLVLSENQFNDPPQPGSQYVIFTVNAIYNGAESGEPFADLGWAIVGSAGNTFLESGSGYCGVYPDPLDNNGETYPGGSITGNVCIAVPSDQIQGATIRVEEQFNFEEDRAFWSLTDAPAQ